MHTSRVLLALLGSVVVSLYSRTQVRRLLVVLIVRWLVFLNIAVVNSAYAFIVAALLVDIDPVVLAYGATIIMMYSLIRFLYRQALQEDLACSHDWHFAGYRCTFISTDML